MTRRRAFSLVELTAASAGATIVIGAALASLMAGAAAIEESAVAPAREQAAAEMAATIVREARTATEISLDESSLTMVRPAETGGSTEVIRYEWSGGAAPTRSSLTNDDSQTTPAIRVNELDTAEFDADPDLGSTRTIDDQTKSGSFEVQIRGRTAVEAGYHNVFTSRISEDFEFEPGRVKGQAAEYDRLVLSITTENDRFFDPPIQDASYPESTTAVIRHARGIDITLSEATSEAIDLTLRLDVTEGWAITASFYSGGSLITEQSHSGDGSGNGINAADVVDDVVREITDVQAVSK